MNGVSHEVGHGVIMVLAVSWGVSWGKSWSVIWNWIDSEWSEGEELPRQLKDLEWLYSVHFLSQVPQPASFMAVGEPEFICSHYTAACFTGAQSLS